MKIAITGHKKGIGQAIYNKLLSHGYEVTGYSLSDGFDIGDKKTRDILISQTDDIDIFINNAFHKQGQTELLQNVINHWQSADKTIIHINSKLIFLNQITQEFLDFKLEKNCTVADYISAKKEQQSIISKRYYEPFPNVINVIIGAVDCGFGRYLQCNKLDPKIVADYLAYCIKMKDSVKLQNIMIDVPTQPDNSNSSLEPANPDPVLTKFSSSAIISKK
jgi:NADP-dependent 3-hydroxy acid dehydrogenase YdfG